MSRIFISHSSKDKTIAGKIGDILEENGQQCWIAPRNIGYGKEWAGRIAIALKNDTKLFFILLSENSNKSPHVLREVNLADTYGVAMLGAYLQEFSLGDSMEYYLSIIQLSKFVDDNEEEDELARKIAEFIIENEEEVLREADERRRIQTEAFLVQLEDYVSRGIEDDIAKILDSSKIAVLYGEGGMGKTCLAVNYYMRDKGRYGSAVFVNAETPQDLFKSLGMIENGELKNMKALVLTAFEKTIERLLKDREGKLLLIIDNYSYDRGRVRLMEFENLLSEVVTELNKQERVHIIVTTRLTETTFGKAEALRVGDFSESLALEYFRTNKEEDFVVDEKAAVELIHKYGVLRQNNSEDQMEYTIPAIVCVSIKNSAKLKKGYENVTKIVGNKRTLGDLMRVQLEILSKDQVNQGELFAEILQIVSFLNGTKIHRDFLFGIVSALKKMRGQDLSREQFDSCLDFYNSKISLLNSLNEGAAEVFTIHRNFQKELNRQIAAENRREIKEALMQAFMKKAHPYSYYGTHTLADAGGVMQHVLAFFEAVKEEDNGETYYELLLAAAWYYGYIARDREIYQKLFDTLADGDQIPVCIKVMAKADRVLISMASETNDLSPEYIDEWIEDSEFDLDDIGTEEERYRAKIRFLTARAHYESFYATKEEAFSTVESALELCQKFRSFLAETRPLRKESYVYVIEAMAVLLCRQAALLRMKTGEYRESVEKCRSAREWLADRRYIKCLRDLNLNNGNSYLNAFSLNLEGVSLMETNASLQELYESEHLNQSALDEYLMIHYRPGIANQQLNFTNIYRAQALKIIDGINAFVNPEKKTLSAMEWQKLYESERVVPELTDREGKTKSVKEWAEIYHQCILLAKEYRELARRTKESYKAPLTVAYYSYIFTLAVCETHYNGYDDSEKAEILKNANYNKSIQDGIEFEDGLETAMNLPGLDAGQRSILMRYRGILYKKLAGFSTDTGERDGYYNNALECFEEAIRIAKSVNNSKAEKLAKREIEKLKF